MDKLKIQQLRSAIEAAIKPLELEHGVAFEVGSANYNRTGCKFNFNVVEAQSPDQKGMNFLELTFRAKCESFGLRADDFGKSFIAHGETFTISGLKPKNRKFPVIATDNNGGSYKFRALDVARKVHVLPPLDAA